MIKRLIWLVTGVVVGWGSSFWLARALRRRLERYLPDRVVHEVTARVRNARSHIAAAAEEGRSAMHARETALRAEFRRPA